VVLILVATGVLTALSLLIALLIRLVWALRRRKPQRFWRRTLWCHLVLVPVYLLIVVPLAMAWFITRSVGTRGDERGYQGPRVAADGSWIPQDRATLKAERNGRKVDPELLAAARSETVHFSARDGVPLRGFFVSARKPRRNLGVVLVHGLFRGGLELDRVAAMFHQLGADVLILEMRNHGGSGRAPATFGLHESRDVLAAVDFLRARPGHHEDRIVLFGVSLGSAAVALAAPQVPDLAGLVLDAPMTNIADTAARMLSAPSRNGSTGPQIPAPLRFLILKYAELWSGLKLSQIRPIDALQRLPLDLPVLLIGESEDYRVPPAVVRAAYETLPQSPGVKQLWIRQGSGHGKAWLDDPAGYQAHLADFLNRVDRSSM
jgi:pimeloyl-ACP methyl ester carboxylesterase